MSLINYVDFSDDWGTFERCKPYTHDITWNSDIYGQQLNTILH